MGPGVKNSIGSIPVLVSVLISVVTRSVFLFSLALSFAHESRRIARQRLKAEWFIIKF